MKGLDNTEYLIALLAFNVLAVIFILLAIHKPRWGRLAYFLLFAWACYMNWTISQKDPGAYQEYANLALLDIYRDFIQGWFRLNTQWAVGVIATCQGLIAISMILKGWIYKLGIVGGIVFLLSIVPMGVGSGIPCTIIFSAGLVILFRKGNEFLWMRKRNPTLSFNNFL